MHAGCGYSSISDYSDFRLLASASAVMLILCTKQPLAGTCLRTREGNRIIRSREMEALLLKNSRPITYYLLEEDWLA